MSLDIKLAAALISQPLDSRRTNRLPNRPRYKLAGADAARVPNCQSTLSRRLHGRVRAEVALAIQFDGSGWAKDDTRALNISKAVIDSRFANHRFFGGLGYHPLK